MASIFNLYIIICYKKYRYDVCEWLLMITNNVDIRTVVMILLKICNSGVIDFVLWGDRWSIAEAGWYLLIVYSKNYLIIWLLITRSHFSSTYAINFSFPSINHEFLEIIWMFIGLNVEEILLFRGSVEFHFRSRVKLITKKLSICIIRSMV